MKAMASPSAVPGVIRPSRVTALSCWNWVRLLGSTVFSTVTSADRGTFWPAALRR